MGMFDWVEFEGQQYQTKDTPNQLCDNYRIDELGRLWEEQYDAEWQTDSQSLFGGHIHQSNQRWVECRDFTGPMRFYRENKEHGGYKNDAWIEWQAEFKCGLMIGLKMLEGDKFLTWYQEAIEKRGLE
jgi:hypothetical protein